MYRYLSCSGYASSISEALASLILRMSSNFGFIRPAQLQIPPVTPLSAFLVQINATPTQRQRNVVKIKP